MMPRSCLEDMAWRHNGNRRISGAGRWMGMGGAARRFISICNSYAAKPGLTVTDRDSPQQHRPVRETTATGAAGRDLLFSSAFLDGISSVVVPCLRLKTRGLFWALATFLPRNRAVGCVAFFVLAAGTTCTARRPHEPTFRLQGTDARDVHLQDSRRKGA